MNEACHYSLDCEPGHFKLSPLGFRQWAKEFYQSRHALRPDGFSPVPYFLLCRAIELWFKAIHLEADEDLRPDDFKRKGHIGHDLIASYDMLPVDHKVLTNQQFELLNRANEFYKASVKAFEYFRVHDAVKGFSNFPNLDALDALAKAIIEG